MLRSLAIVLFITATTFCWSCTPAPYPPPPQIALPSGPEPSFDSGNGDGLMLEMSDPDANSRILGDINPDPSGSEWRFTGIHPRFRLQLRTAGKLSFYMRFFVHEQALRERGPVSFRVAVNHNSLESYRFTEPGDMEYLRPIPEEWITGPGPVDIDVEVVPPWRQPDGTNLGILLHSIGFQRREK